MNGLKLAAMALAATALGGCIREAQIAMPAHVAAGTERLEVAGMGYGESGDFTLGASTGAFRRAAIEHRSDDGAFVWNRGGGSFSLAGPEVGGALAGDCRYREDILDSGIVEATTRPFIYRCRFDRSGTPLEARLVLGEVPRSPGRVSGTTRTGILDYDGRLIAISAIHDMEGGRVPSGTALGYAFHVDGRQIGAIDLNGGDKTIYAPRSGPDREAVLAAAMALAILWHDGA